MPDLPEVSQTFDADVEPAWAAVSRLSVAFDSLTTHVLEAVVALERFSQTDASQASAAAAAAEATSQQADAAGAAAAKAGEAATATQAQAEASGNAARAAAADAAAQSAASESAADSAKNAYLNAMAKRMESAATTDDAKAQYLLAMAERMQANTARDAAGSTLAAGAAAGAATGFWARWGNVIHWVIAGGSEFLAVFIPATVAAGAAAAVMAEGVQTATEHLQAMYVTQEATANIFHTTVGEMVGMRSVLQQAQTAADPRVYELLGAAITVVSHDSGEFVRMGVQVLAILDQFAAKITGELTGSMGGQLHTLLAGGARDLAGLGAVLGNVSHSVLNLAADMPGLAEVLLAALAAASRFLEVLTSMPGIIITVAMGMEEFNRWGGLLSSMLGRLTGAATQTTGAWYNLWGNALIVSQNFVRVALTGFANVASGLGNLMMNVGAFSSRFGASMIAAGTAEQVVGEEGVAAAAETSVLQDSLFTTGAAAQVAGAELIAAGAEVDTFAAEVDAAAAAITPLEAILAVIAAVGLGIFIDKVATATDAMQKWAQATNKALQSTSDLQLIPKITSDIANAANLQTAAQDRLNRAVAQGSSVTGGATDRLSQLGAQAYGAALDVQTLSQEHQHLNSALQNVMTGAGMLANTYKTTFIGALAIAQGAGVNLTNSIRGQGAAAVDARLQIANYVAGMGAMGESSTAVGRDVTMLGISSALTATKVGQLNQAVDQFVSGVTGGTSAMGGLVESIDNIGKVTLTSASALKGYNATVGLTTAQSAQALTNFGQVGSQVWQNFDNALTGSGEQLADWFRTAGTEGAIGQAQFTTAMQAIVAQFVPFAAKSATAQQTLIGFAQAQGLNITKFSQLQSMFKSSGAASAALTGAVQQTTARMADMNAVAQALGSSIGTDVVGAMNNARLAASGLTGAAQSLSQAWYSQHQINYQVVSGFFQTYQALLKVSGSSVTARQDADALARQLGMTQSQVQQLNAYLAQYNGELSRVPKTVTTQLTLTGYITPGAQAALAAAGVSNVELAHIRGVMPGHQLGAAYVPPGAFVAGEAGPEIIRARGGESVTPAWRSAPILRGAGGGGGGPTVVHSHIYIDGREVFTAVQGEAYQYERRNGLTTTGSLAPPS